MVTTLTYELARRGGGIGVAAMCAGGRDGVAEAAAAAGEVHLLLIETVFPARRGGGIGVAAMCAGGGQGGAVVIEV
ncbi:hypothetical protein MAHJHV55_51900 [Mycobacterium avium subsp. hominissuis]